MGKKTILDAALLVGSLAFALVVAVFLARLEVARLPRGASPLRRRANPTLT